VTRYFDPATRSERIRKYAELAAVPPPPPTLEEIAEQETEAMLDKWQAAPPRGRGRIPKGESPVNERMTKFVVAKYLEGFSYRDIARDCRISPQTVSNILRKSNITRIMEVSKSRIAGLIPKAVDVAEIHLNNNDKEVAMKILDKSGALNVDPTSQSGGQFGGVTINLGFLDAGRAKIVLASQSTSGPDSGPIDVDAKTYENKG